MTAEQFNAGRGRVGLTQVQAARRLGVSQPYLSQLEDGSRPATRALARKAAALYRLPSALPFSDELKAEDLHAGELERQLAALGYPGFSHVRSKAKRNPAEVVLRALAQRDLDTRLVEALPWVLMTYTDSDWAWLRDRAKLRNLQNRLGYVVHLAECLESGLAVQTLSRWEAELEDARLVQEGTLCRDSMPEPERHWLRTHRPEAAVHWNLLTSLTPEQLPYAAR